MGIRMDQHMGLNEAGQKYLEKYGKILGHKVVREEYTNGEVKEVSRDPIYDQEVYEEWVGSYDPTPLKQYVAKDGSIFREAVQASPWSSGPMIFMALQDENEEWIEETLWDEKEIDRA
jgi:hypothetical protein